MNTNRRCLRCTTPCKLFERFREGLVKKHSNLNKMNHLNRSKFLQETLLLWIPSERQLPPFGSKLRAYFLKLLGTSRVGNTHNLVLASCKKLHLNPLLGRTLGEQSHFSLVECSVLLQCSNYIVRYKVDRAWTFGSSNLNDQSQISCD